ncbi:sugar ABC transporter substrate-binding protein [Streptomyces ficellus]|uniref:Sugar ABC transporter substrate-binding protein n=1 Tax=Streptomyces ficellus TaxID=1977088 RepID=A0A6I6FVY2_9ACTN|nr:substrate-binding domain-containing protein [Streptomyces ficellus]QGV82168.1 sugar ABC transporter substrate-binding protein [Streptomyces ficellus]
MNRHRTTETEEVDEVDEVAEGKAHRRRTVPALLLAAGLALTSGLAACGEAAEVRDPQTRTARDSRTVGLLLPDSTNRFAEFDRPLIERRVAELCPECDVEFASAQADVATQQRQLDAMITKGVRVIILDAVDSKSLSSSVDRARRAGIEVIAYDRLVEGPVSAYVSFDGERVGRLQGEALLRALGDEARDGQIVMMNGAATDPNSAWFKEGALAALEGKVTIGKAYDTAEWRPVNAHVNMAGAIASLGADEIDGVYSANDGLAAGIISALKAAKIHPLPPVTGQDAELAGIQRIVAGDQYMTVYKPFRLEANAAAEMAVALVRGGTPYGIATGTVDSPTTPDIPSVLLTPIAVTADTIEETVVKDGVYTVDQICTPRYADACERAGLTPPSPAP